MTPLPDGTFVPTVAIDQSSPAADQGSCTTAGSAEDAREIARPFDLLAILDADCAPTDPSAAVLDVCGECGGDGTSCLRFASGFETSDTGDWSAASP